MDYGIAPDHIWDALEIDEYQHRIGLSKTLGATWLRVGINYQQVYQPHLDAPWWDDVEQRIEAASSAGMKILVLLSDDEPSHYINGVTAQFAVEVMQKLGRHIAAVEVHNEPNIERFWPTGPNPRAYAALYRSVKLAVKSVANVPVITGGLAPSGDGDGGVSPESFIRAMLTELAATGTTVDGVGLHPYCFPSLPVEREPWSMWGFMPRIRALLASHGMAEVPLWFTEFGAPTDGERGLGEYGQAETITQGLALALADPLPVGPIFLYSLIDQETGASDMEGSFGLYSDKLIPKTAAGNLIADATVPAPDPVEPPTEPSPPKRDSVDDLLLAVIHRLHTWSGCSCDIKD